MRGKTFIGFLAAAFSAAAVLVFVFSCKAPPIPPYEEEAQKQQPAPVEPAPVAEVAADASGGKAVIAKTNIDLGDIERGKEAVANFTIKNASSKEVLHIKRVRGS